MNCESLVVDDVQLPISSDLDLVRAREQGRVLAGQLGFQHSDLTLIAQPTVSYVSPNAMGSLSFAPVPNANGKATINVTVDDGGGVNTVVTRSFTVTVLSALIAQVWLSPALIAVRVVPAGGVACP